MKVNFNQVEIENENLKKTVETDNKFKELIVNYVGEKLKPEDENITTEMVVDVFASEFPEFLMAVAEENFIRGYEQGIQDTESFIDEESCGNPHIDVGSNGE